MVSELQSNNVVTDFRDLCREGKCHRLYQIVDKMTGTLMIEPSQLELSFKSDAILPATIMSSVEFVSDQR